MRYSIITSNDFTTKTKINCNMFVLFCIRSSKILSCVMSCSRAVLFIMFRDGIAMDFPLSSKLCPRKILLWQQIHLTSVKKVRIYFQSAELNFVRSIQDHIYATLKPDCVNLVLIVSDFCLARIFASQAIDNQKKAFKSWGILGDWDNKCYFTFNKSYVQNQLRQFYSLYEKVWYS